MKKKECSSLPVVLCRTLMIIEHVGHKMEFFGRIANLTVPNMALTVLRVDHTFEGIAFSIHSYKEGTDPEVSAAHGSESQSVKYCSVFIYLFFERKKRYVIRF